MNYQESIGKLLAENIELPLDELVQSVEEPSDSSLGDYAFPCFRLAKAFRKAPPVIAQELVEGINKCERPEWLDKAVATGPYVNFFLDRVFFAGNTLNAVLKEGGNYGKSQEGRGKKVVMDYSSPNIAKHFHIGHLGSTIIGNSIYKIYTHLGYDVTGINYLGDWGTQFGKLIVAYKRWGSQEEIEATEIDGLVRIYVKFHEEADKDPSLYDEARAWVVRMQNGDEEGLRLWKWFVDLSLRAYERIYKLLDVRFDVYRGESYYSDKMDAVAAELTEKGLLQTSEGAQIVDLEAYGMPPCLILRSDGGTLYPTRDIAAALDRYAEYKFDLSLYVTGVEQSMHFSQFFKVLELMGYPWAKNMVHIANGMLLFESGKMSTRRGDVIKIEDLLNEAIDNTLKIIEEKNPELQDKQIVAEQVGVGALIFNKLYNSRIKDSMFSWERAINFDGETGPYVQYTHARACSVLEKAQYKTDSPDMSLLTDNECFGVLRLLYSYPKCIREAAVKFEPFIIARHMVALAQAYNAFYHNHTILVEDRLLQGARVALTAAVQVVLEGGLRLLGIGAPAKM